MDTSDHANLPFERLPDLPNPDPEPVDGVRIGESPVPGLTLKRILRGNTDAINRISWSPNGRYLASPSNDRTVWIWDPISGKPVVVLDGPNDDVSCVAWSPDGRRLAFGSKDSTIRIWEVEPWKALVKLKAEPEPVTSIFWSRPQELFQLSWAFGISLVKNA